MDVFPEGKLSLLDFITEFVIIECKLCHSQLIFKLIV